MDRVRNDHHSYFPLPFMALSSFHSLQNKPLQLFSTSSNISCFFSCPRSLQCNIKKESQCCLRFFFVLKDENFLASNKNVMKDITFKKKSFKNLKALPELSNSSLNPFEISRVEAFTEKFKGEVLRINAEIDGEEDEVIIFKGFSSSLMRPTSVDPSEPILPSNSEILSIDRIKGPYNPSDIQIIQGGISWEEFDLILKDNKL